MIDWHTYIYIYIHIHIHIYVLPQWLSSKESCNAGGPGVVGSVPGLWRPPEGGHGNPLQCSCLENPMNWGAWQATVHGVTVSDMTDTRALVHSRILGSCYRTFTVPAFQWDGEHVMHPTVPCFGLAVGYVTRGSSDYPASTRWQDFPTSSMGCL